MQLKVIENDAPVSQGIVIEKINTEVKVNRISLGDSKTIAKFGFLKLAKQIHSDKELINLIEENSKEGIEEEIIYVRRDFANFIND